MHNVSADQIEKNIRLIQMVEKYPAIYNHDPAQQNHGESADAIWEKIGKDLQESADSCKKKWRLLRSSLIRYIKVFKDKSTSKGNRYRPYYLLKHMEFLLPYINDEKGIIKREKSNKSVKSIGLIKRDRSEEDTIIYTSSTPSTITYSVSTIAPTSSKQSVTSEHMKMEGQQDIQQYYNQAHHHTGVKILGEDFLTYPAGEQLIYQASSDCTEDIQQQECIAQDTTQQQECIQTQESTQQAQIKQQLGASATTIIPIPNFNNFLTTGTNQQNENASADLYFLIGLMPDFRALSNDQKRKLKIGILKMIDELACGTPNA